MREIRSRDNPRLRRWERLVRDSRARRSERRAMIEGVHLVAAYLEQGSRLLALLVSESGLKRAEVALLASRAALEPVALSDSLFGRIADTEAPTGIAAEIEIPAHEADLSASLRCVFLDEIQDAGNVGAIVRSAAAFGVRDVVLGKGCADAWSPKALRAGMGGQFLLRIMEGRDLSAMVERFAGTTVCAVAHGGRPLHALDLDGRLGWIFGSEGRGVSEALASKADYRATIPTAPGAESLNVAAAAAICLYEARRRVSSADAPS